MDWPWATRMKRKAVMLPDRMLLGGFRPPFAFTLWIWPDILINTQGNTLLSWADRCPHQCKWRVLICGSRWFFIQGGLENGKVREACESETIETQGRRFHRCVPSWLHMPYGIFDILLHCFLLFCGYNGCVSSVIGLVIQGNMGRGHLDFTQN